MMREYNERRGAHPSPDQMREEMRMRHEKLDQVRACVCVYVCMYACAYVSVCQFLYVSYETS
jgi:hypothetical protein